jgi:hypothetical protein
VLPRLPRGPRRDVEHQRASHGGRRETLRGEGRRGEDLVTALVVSENAERPVKSDPRARRPDMVALIVVGGALIRQGKLDGSRLGKSPEMADEILRAFGDAVSSNPNGDVDPARREILKAVAIMQPFRTDINDFRIAISALTELAYDQVSAELASLEDRGVLLRRGTALRVVPDLLGDTP